MNILVKRSAGALLAGAGIAAAATMDTAPRLLVSVSVGLPALILLILSRLELGRSFAVAPKAIALVTTGPYARVQHPMYMFLDLFLGALITACGWPLLVIAWGMLAMVQIVRAQREEQVLSAAFGEAYEAYRRRTWI